MDEDATDAAWAQAENEEQRRREEEWLTNDPGYFEWLEQIAAQAHNQAACAASEQR